MLFPTFLIIIVSGFVAVKLYGFTKNKGRLKFLGLTATAVLILIMHLFVFADNFIDSSTFSAVANFIFEWGHVTCLALVLSSLAVFIRESKPVFAQFPMLYTGLPLLIVISYILVKDTYALKNWLISIYQGGAITVALLMYSVYTYRRNQYVLILSGVVIFLLSYLFYWHIPIIQESYPWVWQVLFAVGLVTTTLGYDHIQPGSKSAPAVTQNEI